ncbi:ATP-binding protein [Basfia succiniciproducens]|uniref:ATPase n=1 Tax=Basfia succiniciproducens TaxID=653940 RepID=A0A1G5CSB0_9PAST|nr:ATP-binding protein [Basfia succiniciproducens]QIM69549.1 selenocysteine synthase [Basfia succiniciproducens]SCY05264.1 ATPase [Basfia succiniciproducens]
MKDPIYFHRTELADKLIYNLKGGITHALTLFAPRRMGKTQFLLNDVKPQAEKNGFNVFYFSFFDQMGDVQTSFTVALQAFLNDVSSSGGKTLKRVNRIDVMGVGIGLQDEQSHPFLSISQLINELAQKSDKPVLMLLDEVQELARIKGTEQMVKSLRTGLDINQNQVKVIFTGSSTNGLRAMFNDNKAAFFHFAHPLDFPNLGKDFIEFLAGIYQQRTNKILDTDLLYHYFERFHFSPLYLRAVIQDMILNPTLSLEVAAEYRLTQVDENSENRQAWLQLSELERLILLAVLNGETAIYSKGTRQFFADKLGLENISTSTIQGKVRKLERAELLTRNVGGTLKINNVYFKTWLRENVN